MRTSVVTRILLGVALAVFPLRAANQILLRYVDVGDRGRAGAVAVDREGNLFTVLSIVEDSGRPLNRVVKTDANGVWIASFDFAASAVNALAVNARDEVILVGSADRMGFPNSGRSDIPSSDVAGFVLKLDPGLNNIVFSKLLPAYSEVKAVALDAAGNLFIGGSTSAADFPVTPGAYQIAPPGETTPNMPVYAFLTELSPDGGKILYSTFFGGDNAECTGSGLCTGSGSTFVSALAVDPSGGVVIGGYTNAAGLPIPPSAVNLGSGHAKGFLARFAAGAPMQLKWVTLLRAGANEIFSFLSINALAVDSSGNVLVAGAASTPFPTTAGVVQENLPFGLTLGLAAGFVAKMNPEGANFIWSSHFGYGSGPSALALDPQGEVVITGSAEAGTLPGDQPSGILTGIPSGNYASSAIPVIGLLLGTSLNAYVARLSSDGTTLRGLTESVGGATGQDLALTPAGNFVALGSSGALWIETGTSGPSLLATASAASDQVSNAVAPYEMLSLTGAGLGPDQPVAGEVSGGAFTSSLSGYQVLFDGVAAPLVSAGFGQLKTIVPGAVFGRDNTRLQIVTPSGVLDGPVLNVRPARPGIFQTFGAAAALNQDGTPNSLVNPAQPGSIVTIFATGTGLVPWKDGQIVAPDDFRVLQGPISVLGSGTGKSLEVLYAGDAPGLVAGVTQVNFRLPAVVDSFGSIFAFQMVQLQCGDAVSPPVTIAVSSPQILPSTISSR